MTTTNSNTIPTVESGIPKKAIQNYWASDLDRLKKAINNKNAISK
ncbi:hypothetical protein [Flavobacterium eburneipallidum]|nr:hypothetical protein [Flavobacterium eburneipallidum]